jgi:hypothetical protein
MSVCCDRVLYPQKTVPTTVEDRAAADLKKPPTTVPTTKEL